MSLKKLTNETLDIKLKSLVASEREILTEVLVHLVEVERRKLYLTFGYSSLFEYLTKGIGYANGSAQRRIDAARFSFAVPAVIDKLESGTINLAQVSLLQKSIREVQVISKTKINSQIKEALLDRLSNKSFAESEVLVAQAFNIQPKEYIKTKHQKDESVRLEVTFTKAQWEKLIKMRELLSHSLPHGSSWDQALEYLAEKVIQQKDKAIPKAEKKSKSNTATVRSPAPAKRTIPLATQRKVYQRDYCCQYQDKTTGRQCRSKWRLTVDHIHPVWDGGGNNVENLRVLCASHNRQTYYWQANLSKSWN